jgi:ribosomal protein S4
MDKVKSTISSWENYIEQYGVYAQTSIAKWDYKESKTVKKSKRMYVHIYYNKWKKADEEIKLHRKILKLKKELESGKGNPKHKKQYSNYFNVNEIIKKSIVVTVNNDVISKEELNFGYFTLISNDVKDATTALEIYRNKDIVEKAFNNLKGRLDFRKRNHTTYQP